MVLLRPVFAVSVAVLQARQAWADLFSKNDPVIKLEAGTVVGVHNSEYDQDFFLGVPYAAPPVGQLRLKQAVSHPLWTCPLKATSYGPRCYGNSLGLAGYSQEDDGSPVDEDCLSINIVRPSGKSDRPLPVLVWIHGGGFLDGSSRDGRYNGSFLVETSVRMNQPIIYASFNYRLGAFGMLGGSVLEAQGLSNIGLHDQRKALAWIQENIGLFGGDPAKVTLFGESAGAMAIGFHLLANRGRNDGLFSAAIAQSGGPFSQDMVNRNATEREEDFRRIAGMAGCGNSSDILTCLRDVPAEALNGAGATLPPNWIIDGELLPDRSIVQLQKREILEVPLLIGTNRNEATSFFQRFSRGPVNTDADFSAFIQGAWGGGPMSRDLVNKWNQFYADEVVNPSAAGLGTVQADGGSQYGQQYGKSTLWQGDMMFTAGRRFANQAWADKGVPSYSYFFDTTPQGVDPATLGVAHFQEIAYTFGNTLGVGWDTQPFPSDPKLRAQHERLANIMSRMWISFAVTGSPNSHQVKDLKVNWPMYSLDDPQNIVFSVSDGVHLQKDDWRQEAIKLMEELPSDL
ncbi:Lipase 2 [Paramyrothecium foliicola]|nr:Lipase 2 [Paramyrothecium foliicola]